MKHFDKKKITLALVVSLLGLMGIFRAGAVAAQEDYTIGAQGCMPMNLPLAQTLQWRSEGVLNNNTQEQWVVCPILNDTFAENIDITTRVVNLGDTDGDIQCLAKITNLTGVTIRSVNQTAPLPAGFSISLILAGLNLDPSQSVSVSCKLQPQFRVISFSVET